MAERFHHFKFYEKCSLQLFPEAPKREYKSLQLYSLQVKFQGLTNQVEFDNEGVRRNISVDVAELKPGGLETVGKWLWERTMESKSRFEVTRKSSVLSVNKTLVVIMALVGCFDFFQHHSMIKRPTEFTTFRTIHTLC